MSIDKHLTQGWQTKRSIIRLPKYTKHIIQIEKAAEHTGMNILLKEGNVPRNV